MKWLLVLWSLNGLGPQTIQPIPMVLGHCAEFIPAGHRGFCITILGGELVIEQPADK